MYSFFCFWITFAKMNAQDIFLIQNNKEFVKTALKVFRFQYENNAVYRKFCDFLNIDSGQVKTVEQIPFLPIQFFKSERVLSDKKPVEITFSSSGTTGNQTSSHFITDVSVYKKSFRKGFSEFYGNGRELWKLTTDNLSTEDLVQNNPLKVYPNPTSNILSLFSQENISNVAIVDMTGKTVYQNNYSQNEVSIDVSNLQQAMYFAKPTTENHVQTIQFIKE